MQAPTAPDERSSSDREDIFQQIFERTPSGIMLLGLDEVITRVNRSYCDIFGLDVDAALQTSPWELVISGWQVEQVEACIKGHLTADDARGELVFDIQRRNDGAPRQVTMRCESFVIDGAVHGALAEFRDVTDLMASRRELELGRKRNQDAQRLGNLGYWERDLVSDELHWSSEVFRIFGATTAPDDTEEMFWDAVHADDRQFLSDSFRDFLQQEEPYRLEHRIVRPDGEVRTVYEEAELRVDEEGRPARVLGVVQDITERIEVERRLQETADRLETLFESTGTGLVVLGEDGALERINLATTLITGYSRHELRNMSLQALIHPEDFDGLREQFRRPRRGGGTLGHRRVRMTRKNGLTATLDVTAVLISGDRGQDAVLAEFRDVTEELRWQEAVTESAEQIDAILEATPDAVVVADDRDIILRVNAATETIFGWKPDALVGQSVAELVGGADRAAHAAYVDHYKRTGIPSTAAGPVVGAYREATGRRADGTEFPVELSVAETVLRGGDKRFVAAIRDISARKAVEDELERVNSELAVRSGERHVLLNQLITAQEAERQKVAYEIHDGPAQQLAAAQMFLEAYVHERDIVVESDDSTSLRRAKQYLESGLVETRRIMSGLRPSLLDDLGLSDALRQLLSELTSATSVRTTLNVGSVPEDLSPELEITIYRIVQESVGNGLKHSGTDRVRVNLAVVGSDIELEIRDWGTGFDQSGVDGPHSGHQYGLVGMRERVELLGGQFVLDSSQGSGTTVKVTLPLSAAPE